MSLAAVLFSLAPDGLGSACRQASKQGVVMKTGTILIASCSDAARKRWRRFLGRSFRSYEVSSRAALSKSLERLKPAVLLLDVDDAQFADVRRIPTIQRASLSTRIVVLTSRPDDKEGTVAIKAGAKGYCHRNISGPLLKKAVQAGQAGEVWIGRRLSASLLDGLITLATKPRKAALGRSLAPSGLQQSLDCLSLREYEIANLIAGGERNKGISNRLSISEKTVKAHLTTVYRKLGVSNRLQLAVYLSNQGKSVSQQSGITADSTQ